MIVAILPPVPIIRKRPYALSMGKAIIESIEELCYTTCASPGDLTRPNRVITSVTARIVMLSILVKTN